MLNFNIFKATAIITAVSASSCFAGQEIPSLAFVQQAAGGAATSAGLLDTASIFKPSLDVISAARPSVDASDLTGSLSLVYQSGDFNTASIEQSGSRNVGLIQQIGYMNSAAISQSGMGHQAFVSQQGRGNVAIIRQR